MSQLTIYSAVSEGNDPPLPSLHTTDAAIVAEELSQRGVYEALPSNLMVFMDSLSVDERKVSPLNLTSTKEAMLNDDLGDFFYKRHKELLGYEPHKRDEDYPGFLPPKKGQGFKVEL